MYYCLAHNSGNLAWLLQEPRYRFAVYLTVFWLFLNLFMLAAEPVIFVP